MMSLKTKRTTAIKLIGKTALVLGANAYTAGALSDSSGATVYCDAYITVDVNGTTYYIPLYSSTA